MVRVKKRYFVVQLDRERDVGRKRALADGEPLALPDGLLAAALKDLVQEVHGDHGRASVTQGLRTIYCNPHTRLCLLVTRHGPHRLVASSIPFLTKIKGERVVPRLIYTGATIRNCYRMMEKHQLNELQLALKELSSDPHYEKEKKILQEKLMTLKQLNNPN